MRDNKDCNAIQLRDTKLIYADSDKKICSTQV